MDVFGLVTTQPENLHRYCYHVGLCTRNANNYKS